MFRFRSMLWCVRALCAVWATALAASGASAAPAATQPARKSVVAVFQLNGEMSEQPAADTLPLFGPPGPSLRDVVTRIKKAADDPEVKAVVVLADGAAIGFAQVEELRAAMQKVKAAGKEVYSHSDSLSMGPYLLLSGASRLSVAPIGDLWVIGFYADAPYLHGLLQKLGIEADFLHCGAYKSAAEMVTRDGPSPEAEQMMNWLLDSIYDTSLKLIADGRKVTVKEARGWIDGGPYSAEKAKAIGMIDAVETRAAFEESLRDKFGKEIVLEKRYGMPTRPVFDLSNPFSLMGAFAEMMGAKKKSNHKPAIAVVYVDGLIMLGKAEASPFGGSGGAMSTDVSRALDEAARDDSIKAVVLRIDSQGGSAVASEIILQATQRLKAKKPFVVSMGNVAGSGGYYVACAADTIFADEATITGSIGVVAGKFATTKMWNSIGITFKPYQRGASAGLLSTDAVFTETERQRMQAWMDEIYGVFKGHVVTIRGKRLKKPIDEIAGGRVYTGRQALDLGLVDQIGTLPDAIAFIADQAKLKDYEVRTVPEPKDFLQLLIEQASGEDDAPGHVLAGGSGLRIGPDSLFKLAAPYLAEIDPEHARLIQAALRELQLVQKEGVVLMMTPAYFGPAPHR